MPRHRSLAASVLAIAAIAGVIELRACDRAARMSAAQLPAEPAVHTCNLCGTTAPFVTLAGRPDAGCPQCGARERHRLLIHYLEHETALPRGRLDVLHFSPNLGEKQLLRGWPGLNYRTADFARNKEDLWADLTAMVFIDDASWDVLIVYHVLEHIVDDGAAMAEMFRILRPGGQALVQVPLEPGRTETYEDPAIVDPKAREEHFGQWDHVRLYAAPDLQGRLEAAGFEVEAVDYLSRLDPAVIERHALRGRFAAPTDERIWIATKPRG